MNPNIEEINATIKALENSIENLKKRRADIKSEDDEYKKLTGDEKTIRDDVTEGQLNYAMGQSQGYTDGLRAATSYLTVALSAVCDEDAKQQVMYAFSDLGELIARSRMKHEKNISIAEKSGWVMEWKGFTHWTKKEKSEPTSEETTI